MTQCSVFLELLENPKHNINMGKKSSVMKCGWYENDLKISRTEEDLCTARSRAGREWSDRRNSRKAAGNYWRLTVCEHSFLMNLIRQLMTTLIISCYIIVSHYTNNVKIVQYYSVSKSCSSFCIYVSSLPHRLCAVFCCVLTVLPATTSDTAEKQVRDINDDG